MGDKPIEVVNIPPPKCFTINSNENVARTWRLWLQQFEWWSIATNLLQKEPEVQVAVFMSCVGPDAAAIFDTFSLTDAEAKSLKEIKAKFTLYFTPKINETYERPPTQYRRNDYREEGERHEDREVPQKEKSHRSKRRNSGHQQHNKSKMDGFREKKGAENRAVRMEEIKKELFVGLDEEAMTRLAEPQTLQPIMIPVTSRGIGMSTVQLAYTAKQYNTDIRVPNINAQYRVYLGLLEAKILSLKSHFTMIPRFNDAAYQHIGMTPSVLKILKTCTMVPVTIKKIIDAVGILSHDDKVYLPVVAKTENADGMIPRPENVMLSSLREIVEDLASADTPLIQRQRFETNCPIPGAIWNNHLLMNPDDIIPENYDFNVDLRADIMVIAPFLSRLQKHAPKMVGGALDPKKMGRASLFLSNEMETLRVPNRNVGEELNAYYDRCVVEGNVTHYTSAVKLTPAERVEGQVLLLGEQPTVVNMMRPLYLARDETLHPYWMHSDFTGVCQIMYGM